MRDPFFDFQTNTSATVKLLQYTARYNVKQFVFASSAAVYGDAIQLPIDEQHPINPQSFYAVSKYTAEQYIQTFARVYGFTSTILRFSNVYGPRQNPTGEAGVIGIFISNLLKKEQCVLYGGSQTRDFIYVKDVAIACRKAVESNITGIFHVSSNTETPISDLHTFISKKLNIDLPISTKPIRSGELLRSNLSNKRTQLKLAWVPIYSLSEGLDETINYFIEDLSQSMEGRNDGAHSNQNSRTVIHSQT